MAVEQQGIEWVVLSNAADVYRKDEAAAKRLAESYTKLSKTVNTSTEAGRREADSLRKVGDATAQVAAKLGAESRIRERAATLVRQHGLAMQTALKASRDLERAGGALTREVIREAQAFDRAEKEVRQLAHAQRQAAGTGLTAALGKQTAAFGSMIGRLVGVTSGIAAITLVIRQLKATFAAFQEFEERMAGVRAVTGATEKQMAALEAQSRKLGETTVFTATQSAEAQEALARAGFTVSENLAALPQILDLAVAGEFDLGRAADITAGLIRGFHFEASQAGLVVDTLAKASNIANTDIGMMADGFKYATPIAEALDISIQDTAAALDVLADNLLKGEMGGSGLRTGLLSIIDPGKKTAKVLSNLDLTAAQLRSTIEEKGLVAGLRLLADANVDLTEVIALAGKRGGPALQILIQNIDKLAEKRGILDDITGEAQRMAKVKLDTLAGDLKELTSAIESLRISVGELFSANLRDAADQLTEFFRAAKELVDTLGELNDATRAYQGLGEKQAGLFGTLAAGLTVVNNALVETSHLLAGFVAAYAEMTAALARLPSLIPGGSERLAKEARSLGELAAALAKVGHGTRSVGDEAAGAAPLVETLSGAQDRVATSSERAAKATQTLAERLREQLEVMTSTGTSSERAARALDLMRQGAAKTIPEAVALTHEIDALAVAIDRMNAANTTARRIAADTGGIVPLPGAAPRGGTSTLPLLEEAVPQQIQHLEAAGDSMREGASETAEATSRMLGQLATFFEKVGGNFGQMAAQLFRLVDIILNAVQAAQQAAAATSSTASKAGGAASGLSSASGFLAVMVAMYELFNAYAEASKGRRFSYEADIAYGQAAGYTGDAAFRDPRVRQSGPDTRQLWNSLRDALDQFRIAMGGILEWMPGLQIQIREDGKSVQAIVGGVIVGVFDTVEQAIREGLSRAIAGADWGDIGDNVRLALEALGGFGNVDVEMVAKLLPRLQELDLVAGGATVSLAKAIIQWRSFFTGLDVESEHLLDLGVPLAEVLAMRKREIELIVADAEARGRSLAGIQDFAGPLQAWMDSLAGLDVALEDEADRTAGLTDVANDQSAAAAAATAANDGLRSSTDLATGSTVAHRDAIDGTRGPLDDSAAAAHGVSEAFREAVREIVSLQAQGSILGDLLSFQEKYGVQIADNEQLRQRIAELEFRSFQIRFQLAVAELVANQALLGLTNAQVNQWQRWAAEVAGLTFTGVAPGGGGGGGRRQARQTAAEDWDEALRIMDRRLAGATPQMLALSDAADRLREMGEAAGKTTEEIAAALHDLAELQIADIVTDWAEAIQQSGETDTQTGLRHLADRAIDDLAAAAEAAAGDPELFAGAAETITGGFAALFQGDIQDQIDQLVASGDQEGLQALFDQVSTFLDGDFPPEMQGVIDMLRQWLEGAVAAGETTIALSDESAAATERDAAAEAAYRQAAEQSAQAERDLAAARDQARDTLTALVDEGLSPSLAAYRQQMRALDEIVQSSLDAAESEEERAFIMDQANKSMTRSQAQFVQGLLGEINALGIDLRAAGIDTHAFAMAMLELKRAEVLAALGTEGFAAAAEKWGLDVPAIVATVTGATLELDEAAQSVARSTRSVSEAARHFVAGVGLVEESTETIADIIEEMRRSELTGMAALEQERLDMLARIAAATGTAAERTIALAAAEEMFARKRQELLDEAFGGVDEWLRQITGAGILGTTPGEQLSTAQADLESLAARAAGGDLEAAAALDDQAEAVIDLLSQLYGGRELALLAQQVVDTVAAARLAGGGGPQPQALGSPAPLSLPPLAALPPAPFSAAFGTAQAVADLTTVVAELQAQGAATRRQMADLTQAEMRQRLTLHSEVVPLLRDLKPTRPIAPPGGRG